MNDDQQKLQDFMASYFHEDWSLDDASPREVLRRYFCDQDSTAKLSSVLRALRELINGDDDDETLSDRLFDEFGCYYYPPGVGLSTRVWLQSVADEFEREITARRAV